MEMEPEFSEDKEEEEEEEEEEELELGLGLTLNCGGGGYTPDSHHSSSKIFSQIVGWPPIRTYRVNSLVNQTKTPNNEVDKGVGGSDPSKTTLENIGEKSSKIDTKVRERGHFVKVYMDGMQIGRKVDLNAHTCYKTLAQALEKMFLRPSTLINSICGGKITPTLPSKLLDSSSDFVLTYEDKEGDSMLVGDVPWRMFLNSVKRLRIMKTSEAGRLAPETNTMKKVEKSKKLI